MVALQSKPRVGMEGMPELVAKADAAVMGAARMAHSREVLGLAHQITMPEPHQVAAVVNMPKPW